jgi:hypothetical protein
MNLNLISVDLYFALTNISKIVDCFLISLSHLTRSKNLIEFGIASEIVQTTVRFESS